MSVFCCLCRSE